MSQPQFTITKSFAASSAELWEAWTDATVFATWMEPYGVDPSSVVIQPHFGGKYFYTMVNAETGDEFHTGGVFLEVTPTQRLSMTWGEPGSPVEESPRLTLSFSEREQETELVFHLHGFSGEPGDGFVYDGWDRALTNLQN
ncbi:SRPBCC family protein [Micrococcoides hystricis]|uniref:SRPBCC domain-containing protein n=1 Tax=Micrococcoides hystricis TaxID=1572761 RepID=A0ABV6PCC0_9MICC